MMYRHLKLAVENYKRSLNSAKDKQQKKKKKKKKKKK